MRKRTWKTRACRVDPIPEGMSARFGAGTIAIPPPELADFLTLSRKVVCHFASFCTWAIHVTAKAKMSLQEIEKNLRMVPGQWSPGLASTHPFNLNESSMRFRAGLFSLWLL